MHEKTLMRKEKRVSYVQYDLGIPETINSTMKHLCTSIFLSFHSDIFLEKVTKELEQTAPFLMHTGLLPSLVNYVDMIGKAKSPVTHPTNNTET